MKIRHLLTGLAIMVSFMAASAFTALAAPAKGRFEEVTEHAITGWAYDSDEPDEALNVNITIKNEETGKEVLNQSVKAGEFRQELLDDDKGYTYGNSDTAKEEADSKASSSVRSLGIFKTTGYCPCKSCSGGWGRHTSTGAVATAGHTIAVDPSVVPYGSKIMINGVVYTAEDKGGGVRGHHIDIFYDTHSESKHHGVQNTEVFLVAA